MARQSDIQLATLEERTQNLQSMLQEQRADLQETVREFHEAFKDHRGEHRTDSDTRWKAATLVLTPLAAVVSSVVTYLITKLI